MKTKKVMPLLLSAIMTFGAVTAVPITANAQTSAVSVQTAQASLATPKISKAESVYGGVKLTWSKVKGAAKYRVYYKGSKGWTKLTDTASTTFTDKAVSSGKTYTYTVRCLSADGKKFTSGYDSKGTKVTYIAAPELTKLEGSNEGVKLTWNKPTGSVKYRVYRKSSGGWTKLTDTTKASYTDKAAKTDNNYTYTVRCLTSDSKRFTSGYNSSGKSFKLLATPKVKAYADGKSVRLSWNKVSGAEKYRIYYKNSNWPGMAWEKLADTTNTSYTDTKVVYNTYFTYTVRCISADSKRFTSGYDTKGVAVYVKMKTPIELDEKTLTLTEGETKLIFANLADIEKPEVWSSSNPKVATVDKDRGYITAKSAGTAVITVKSNGGSASCTVTVLKKTTVKLDKTSVTLGVGEPCTLKATVNTGHKVTWTSSNPKVVKVDANGKLTVTDAFYDGWNGWQQLEVKITAKANGVSATCNVAVDGFRKYHEYAIVPVYEPVDICVCKGCGRLINKSVEPGTPYETEDGRKGIFITKSDHTAHWNAHMDEGVPSGWYSEVVMLKVGERVQREGWYVDE